MKITLADQVVAESKTYKKLRDEFEKYATGAIRGGSVLVSGHRGSGKTTIVSNAINDVHDKLLNRYSLRHRILMVPLHGPDLLKPERAFSEPPPAATNATDQQTPPAQTPKLDEEDRLIKNVLEHVTVALYRALANEFYYGYRKKILQGARATRYKELIGLLRLELDESPDLPTLRELWRHAEALDDGVLFDDHIRVPRDQGIQEIVTLASTAQAFRIITGTQTETETHKDDLTAEMQRVSRLQSNSKDILNAVMGILSGVAVGIGVAQIESSSPYHLLWSSVAGVVTALLGNYTLTRTSTTTRKRTHTKEYTFIPRRDIASLNREIPNLIARARQIGLAPIFVIDELDKSIPPFDKFGDLIGYLKKLVSENAFFCFLTDRNYFNFISSVYQKNKYPREYTYFTHRFYVNYSPEDFHDYLDRCFRITSLQTDFRLSAVFLKYFILNRTNLHTIDIRREMSRWSDDGVISVNGLTSSDGFRYPVMVQLAIEYVLEDAKLKHRSEHEPYFTQLINDTLYYPVRSWALGEKHLDLNKDKFDQYIRDRSESLTQTQTSPGESIPPSDLDFLYLKLKQLLSLLSNPDQLINALSAKDRQDRWTDRYSSATVWPGILESVPKPVPGIPLNYLLLNQDPTNPDLYEWKFDYFGRPIGDQVPNEEDIIRRITFLKTFSAWIDTYTKTPDCLQVLSQHQFIHATPAWDHTKRAIESLKKFTDTNEVYPDLEKDFRNLNEYYSNIMSRLSMLAKILQVGEYLKAIKPSAPWTEFIFVIGNTVDMRFGENDQGIDAVLKAIRGVDSDVSKKFFLNIESIDDWTTSYLMYVKEFTKIVINVPGSEQSWMATWYKRLSDYQVQGVSTFEPTIADLICQLNDYSYSRAFGRDIKTISKEVWSRVILDRFAYRLQGSRSTSVESAAASRGGDNWFLGPAFLQLGFIHPEFILQLETGGVWVEVAQNKYSQAPSHQRYVILITASGFVLPDAGNQLPIIQFVYNLDWKKNLLAIKAALEQITRHYKLPTLVVSAELNDPEGTTTSIITDLVSVVDSFILLSPSGKSLGSKFPEIRGLDEIEKVSRSKSGES